MDKYHEAEYKVFRRKFFWKIFKYMLDAFIGSAGASSGLISSYLLLAKFNDYLGKGTFIAIWVFAIIFSFGLIKVFIGIFNVDFGCDREKLRILVCATMMVIVFANLYFLGVNIGYLSELMLKNC